MGLATLCNELRIYFLRRVGFLGLTRVNVFCASQGVSVWLEVRGPAIRALFISSPSALSRPEVCCCSSEVAIRLTSSNPKTSRRTLPTSCAQPICGLGPLSPQPPSIRAARVHRKHSHFSGRPPRRNPQGRGVPKPWRQRLPTRRNRRGRRMSKLRTVSTADWRSLPVPTTIRSLPLGSVRMAPGRVAKPSRSFDSVVPETYCSGITVRPNPGSAPSDPLAWSTAPMLPSLAGPMR